METAGPTVGSGLTNGRPSREAPGRAPARARGGAAPAAMAASGAAERVHGGPGRETPAWCRAPARMGRVTLSEQQIS